MTEKNNKGIGFHLLYGVVNLIAMLPFGVLYILSDFLYIIVYYVVGYRKKVVRKNLVNSLPHKKEDDIIRIEKKFYHHLCDYGVETIKTLRISEKEIRKRMVFKNPEIVNRLTRTEIPACSAWDITEIGSGYVNRFYLLPEVESGHVYKTLKSKLLMNCFKIRSRFKPKPIEMKGFIALLSKRKTTERLW